MTDEPNNPAPTQADHGNAIAFLEAHGGEDWTLDWLVANAMMQTRLAHTPPAQPEAGEAKKLPRGPVEPVKMPPYHYQTPDYGGGSVSATPPAPADPSDYDNVESDFLEALAQLPNSADVSFADVEKAMTAPADLAIIETLECVFDVYLAAYTDLPDETFCHGLNKDDDLLTLGRIRQAYSALKTLQRTHCR